MHHFLSLDSTTNIKVGASVEIRRTGRRRIRRYPCLYGSVLIVTTEGRVLTCQRLRSWLGCSARDHAWWHLAFDCTEGNVLRVVVQCDVF